MGTPDYPVSERAASYQHIWVINHESSLISIAFLPIRLDRRFHMFVRYLPAFLPEWWVFNSPYIRAGLLISCETWMGDGFPTKGAAYKRAEKDRVLPA